MVDLGVTFEHGDRATAFLKRNTLQFDDIVLFCKRHLVLDLDQVLVELLLNLGQARAGVASLLAVVLCLLDASIASGTSSHFLERSYLDRLSQAVSALGRRDQWLQIATPAQMRLLL